MPMLLTICFGMVLHIGCQVKERPKPAIASKPRPGNYYFGRGCGLEQNTCHPGRGWVIHVDVSVYCWVFLFHCDSQCRISRVGVHAVMLLPVFKFVSGMNSFRITDCSVARLVESVASASWVILMDFIPFCRVCVRVAEVCLVGMNGSWIMTSAVTDYSLRW